MRLPTEEEEEEEEKGEEGEHEEEEDPLQDEEQEQEHEQERLRYLPPELTPALLCPHCSLPPKSGSPPGTPSHAYRGAAKMRRARLSNEADKQNVFAVQERSRLGCGRVLLFLCFTRELLRRPVVDLGCCWWSRAFLVRPDILRCRNHVHFVREIS